MMSKHTPGPWKWSTTIHGDILGLDGNVKNGHHDVIDLLGCGCCTAEAEVKEADMRLIAAAPDLLAACEAVVQIDDADKSGKALVTAQGQGMDGYMKLINYEACIPMLRDAIKKAQGE